MLTLEQTLSPENVQMAYRHYRNDMSPWSTKINHATFVEKPLMFIMQLVDDVWNNRYRADPLRRATISTASGGIRKIAALTLKDKLLQKAFLLQFAPKVEGMFHKHSFAYRSGRNADMAYNLVTQRIADGKNYIIKADIKSCFDHIQLKRLSNQLHKLIHNKPLQKLVTHWLEEHATHPSWLFSKSTGIPQGSTLAPALCNLYLDPLDQYLDSYNISFCRYGDDIIVQCTSEKSMSKAFHRLESKIAELELNLNMDKLYIGKVTSRQRYLGKNLPGSY